MKPKAPFKIALILKAFEDGISHGNIVTPKTKVKDLVKQEYLSLHLVRFLAITTADADPPVSAFCDVMMFTEEKICTRQVD